MDAPFRHTRLWITCAPITALFLIACSLQNFDYLTRDRGSADSGGDGLADDATADTSSPPEGGADGTSDAKVATDATDANSATDALTDAMGDTGGGASDAMDAQEVGTDDADSGDGGTVAPNLVANSNFDQGLAGWAVVVVPGTATHDAFIQAPIGSSTTPQGQAVELAIYSATDAFTVEVSQMLSNLADGTYTFSGFFNRGNDNQAYIFAKGCGGPAQQVSIPLTSPTGWDPVSMTIQVSGGTCQVGFFVDSSATNWLNADGFSFQLVTSSPPDAGSSPESGSLPDASDAGTE
jgi:hypothetical protein